MKTEQIVQQIKQVREGKGDFALLVDMVFRQMGLDGHAISYVDEMPLERTNGVLIVCKENVDASHHRFDKMINLAHELAKDDSFINHIGEPA